MKKLEIIIKPEKLENLKSILDDCKASGVMISNIMGYGNQRGYTQMYRGTEYAVNLLPKVKVETVVSEEIANHIIEKVVQKITTAPTATVKFLFMMLSTQFVSVPVNTAKTPSKPGLTMLIQKKEAAYYGI